MPQLEAPSVLQVTSGTTTTFTLRGSDLDGDTLTYHTEDEGTGMVQVDSATGQVDYTPDVNKPLNLRRDSLNKMDMLTCYLCFISWKHFISFFFILPFLLHCSTTERFLIRQNKMVHKGSAYLSFFKQLDKEMFVLCQMG